MKMATLVMVRVKETNYVYHTYFYCFDFQILMNVYLIHVTPTQHVITPLVALVVRVTVVILEMAFSVQVSLLCTIDLLD